MAIKIPSWIAQLKEGPPDLDEVWRNFLKKFRNSNNNAPHNDNPFNQPMGLPSGKHFALLALGSVLFFWLVSGFYIVDAGRVGVILRFGKFQEVTGPGPHWHFPYPIEAQAQGSPVNVSQVRTVELGYRNNVKSKVLHESLMLTDDENIIDNQYAIQYTVKDPVEFLFTNKDPDATVMQVAETAIREVVGRHKMDFVLYEGRSQIADEAQHLMQQILDRYKTGILISKVNMQNAQPPEQVQAAFDDAVKAGQDRERQNNEGQAYANDIVPRAKGTASALIEEAKAYSQRVVARATGDASRFKQILVEYDKAPVVTRERLYQDMMQQVLSNTSKVVADGKNGSNLLYLPLDKLINQSSSNGSNATNTDQTANSADQPIGDRRPSVNSSGNSAPTAAQGVDIDRSRDALKEREREDR
ncbi:MAG: FtsH protease activity modulator HflK [Betaproteobacteria bacterium]|nr:FtsH protease activity modulator HflK [Betaproteobacteria bacterium]MDE2423781.1 FtsH protease activity modulator HflK [Betaproteobacteria bacterium]